MHKYASNLEMNTEILTQLQNAFRVILHSTKHVSYKRLIYTAMCSECEQHVFLIIECFNVILEIHWNEPLTIYLH